MQSAKTKSTKVAGNSLKAEKEFYGGKRNPSVTGNAAQWQSNLPSMCVALGSMPSTTRKEMAKGRRGRVGSREEKKEAPRLPVKSIFLHNHRVPPLDYERPQGRH